MDRRRIVPPCTGLTNRQPMVVSWISALRWKASCALPMTSGARVIDLDAAGNGELGLAASNGARRIADGIEPGCAQPVDGDPRNGFGQARQQQRHARHVAIVLAGLIGAAEHDLVERRPVDLGMALDERPDGHGGEIVGTHLGKRAAIAADRRAHAIAEKNVARVRHVQTR